MERTENGKQKKKKRKYGIVKKELRWLKKKRRRKLRTPKWKGKWTKSLEQKDGG